MPTPSRVNKIETTLKKVRVQKFEMQKDRGRGRQRTKLIICRFGHKLFLWALKSCNGDLILRIQDPYGMSIVFLGKVEKQLYATISPSNLNGMHDIVSVLF
jgi:hypothetical protein